MKKVDLSDYANRILSDEDRPLFDEAALSASAGALRSAYVMIWLSCAESLKRRFREAEQYDNAAGKIVGKIDAREKGHNSVDKMLIDSAWEYGFISDSGHTVLSHIYVMRNIYAHPYEEAPSQEEVTYAADTVVSLVLSQQVKLRHGFGQRLLDDLLRDISYLDDQYSAVAACVLRILPRLDESIYGWILTKYWEELEDGWSDPSMRIFLRRGVMFSHAMLLETGVEVFSREKWHELVRQFPNTLMRVVCADARIFNDLDSLAQDSLIGAILEDSETRARALTHLEYLDGRGALSERQRERFQERVSQLSSRELRASRLRTTTCYEKLVSAMRAYDWYIQNPAISLLMSNGPRQAEELTDAQQETIGRNILQASEGDARSGVIFLRMLAEDPMPWPPGVLRGIVLETLINEDSVIRDKMKHIGLVASVLAELDETIRDALLKQVAELLEGGTPKIWVYREDFDPVFNALDEYDWAVRLLEILEEKLPTEDDEDA